MDLAGLYESAENYPTSLSHYKMAGEYGKIDAIRVEAELTFQKGDITGAAKLQSTYLSMAKEPDFEGWTFMGDLQKMLGNSSAAEIAYNKALEELKLQMISPPTVAGVQ